LLCVVCLDPADASFLLLQLLVSNNVQPFGFEGCYFELLILSEFPKLLLESYDLHPEGAIMSWPA
jgi:hypothetical protein